MNFNEIDYDTTLSENFDLSDIENVNATENTLGAAGGAILEGLSWVYRFD